MFWGAPKKRKDEDKDRQIKELKQVFPSIRRPNNDDNLFEIKFVVNNQYSSLRVFIPADFPGTRPVLQASGPITHPWLDQFKQVNGSDKLMQWTRNSSLVEVVEESLSALLTGTNQMDGASTNTVPSYNPTAGYPPLAHSNSSPSNHQHSSSHLPVAAVAQPLHASGGYPGLAGHSLHALGDHAYPVQAQAQAQVQSASMQPVYAQATATATPTSASSSAVVAQKPSSAADTAATAYPSAQQPQQGVRRQVSGGLPALPSSFPELDQLTSIQLQRLLTDQVALEAHLSEVETIKQMQTVIAQMKQSNEENARRNLRMEGELVIAAEEAEAQQSALKVLVHEYREKLGAVKKRCETPLDAVLKELKATKNELDSQSEDLGASFVEGKLELGQFLTEFLEQRGKYHELTAKLKIVGK